MGPMYVTQFNPAHRLADPTQSNGTTEWKLTEIQGNNENEVWTKF